MSSEDRPVTFHVEGEAGVLPATVATPLSVVLNELLQNAIDHASRPYGQNVFAGKPAGVIGVSVGAIGTAVAQQHLRNVRP